MRFKSPTETPIQIGLTSGHTCSIGPDYVEVDKRFHRQAVAEGAIPEGLEQSTAPSNTAQASKSELIEAAIRAMIDNPKEGDFTADGKPAVPKLSERIGFTLSRDERDTAWAAVSAALDAGEA